MQGDPNISRPMSTTELLQASGVSSAPRVAPGRDQGRRAEQGREGDTPSSSPPLPPSSDASAEPPPPPTPRTPPALLGSEVPIPVYLAPAALYICGCSAALGVVLGACAPRALSIARGSSLLALYDAIVRAADVKGALFPGAATTAADGVAAWVRPQLHLYLCLWATFHLLEFGITARFNPTRLLKDSFLLQNGALYHVAHLTSLTEFLVEASFAPRYKGVGLLTYIGFALCLFGQSLRSLAMVHAANNFSHRVASRRRHDHELVTDGVYSFSRHPSYVGFFWWAIGTQLLLANPLSLALFVVLLWRFFAHRIRDEERHLVAFFGQAYHDYRRRTGTKLPLIS